MWLWSLLILVVMRSAEESLCVLGEKDSQYTKTDEARADATMSA